MRTSIYARYQEKGITLEEMQNFESCDTDLKGRCERKLPAITAADNASYLAHLIDQSVRLNPHFYRSSCDLNGEVVLFEAIDTEIRDKDGSPVVRAEKIYMRIPVSEFVDFDSIKNADDTGRFAGEYFNLVQGVLNEVNGKEHAFQRKLKHAGLPLIKQARTERRKTR